LNKFKFY